MDGLERGSVAQLDEVNAEVVLARNGLLDALDALKEHLDALILVGAQAVYLHTGEAQIAIAEYTTDGDIAIDPDLLGSDPLIEIAMRSGGFEPLKDAAGKNVIGSWESSRGVEVDLMVPAAVAGTGTAKSRGVEAPPHARHSMRRTKGLEAALVDNSVMTIAAIGASPDVRSWEIKVAGPAALLVAKLHKVSERLGQSGRSENKDAHDIYRILVAIPTQPLAESINRLIAEAVSADVTNEAIVLLRSLFATNSAEGSRMAGATEEGLGDPQQVALSVAVLAGELLDALGSA